MTDCLKDALASAGLTATVKDGAVLIHGVARLPEDRKQKLKNYLRRSGGKCSGSEVRCLDCCFSSVSSNIPRTKPAPVASEPKTSLDAGWMDLIQERFGVDDAKATAIGLEIYYRSGGPCVYQDNPAFMIDLLPKRFRQTGKISLAMITSKEAGYLLMVPSAEGYYYIPTKAVGVMTDQALDDTLWIYPPG